jgi:hypothetical protein
MIDFNQFTLDKNIKNDNCSGLIFKAEVQSFMDKRHTYVNTYKIVLLRRKSCKCINCQILYDCYLESCSNECWPILPDNITNGLLYTLNIINEHKDWETGNVDDYDFTFVELH